MSFDSFQQALAAAAALAVAVGVVIALLELRGQNRLHQIDTVMRLFSSFGEESFLHHYRRVTSWPFASYEDFREGATEDDHVSLMVVSVFFENMGLLYRRKLAPIDLLDDLLSAPIVTTWQKVRPIWDGMRAEYSQPQWVEWFELLNDAIVARVARPNGKRPASRWRPWARRRRSG